MTCKSPGKITTRIFGESGDICLSKRNKRGYISDETNPNSSLNKSDYLFHTLLRLEKTTYGASTSWHSLHRELPRSLSQGTPDARRSLDVPGCHLINLKHGTRNQFFQNHLELCPLAKAHTHKHKQTCSCVHKMFCGL